MERPVSKMNIFFLSKKGGERKPPEFPVRMLNYPISQWNGLLSFPSSSKPIDPLSVILFTAHAVLSLISRIKDWSIKIIPAFEGSKQTTLKSYDNCQSTLKSLRKKTLEVNSAWRNTVYCS